jgi:hypothetical protein
MDQRPPPPDRFGDFGFALFSHDKGIDQTVDLALDRLV